MGLKFNQEVGATDINLTTVSIGMLFKAMEAQLPKEQRLMVYNPLAANVVHIDIFYVMSDTCTAS